MVSETFQYPKKHTRPSRSYLYGITHPGDGAEIAMTGVDGTNTVYTIEQQGLECVVSYYSGEEFGELPKQQLVRCLLVHQEVVERVMLDRPVLPAKFGTLLDSSQKVLDLLCQGHSQFVKELASIRGKVEVEVAATWDISSVLREIALNEEVVRIKQAVIRNGQPPVEEKVRLGQLVKAHMDKRRKDYRELMVGLLSPFSADVVSNALLSDEMVMNVAFLVEQARQGEFDEAVGQLDDLFHNEIVFRVIGPLPPYSFSTVDVTPLRLEQVEEAKQTLGLGPVVSEAEVRNRYRHLAAQEQRHLRLGGDAAHGQFQRLREAADLLARHCRARDEAAKNEGRPESAGQDVDLLFDIAIRKSPGDDAHFPSFGGPQMAYRR